MNYLSGNECVRNLFVAIEEFCSKYPFFLKLFQEVTQGSEEQVKIWANKEISFEEKVQFLTVEQALRIYILVRAIFESHGIKSELDFSMYQFSFSSVCSFFAGKN